MFIRKGITALSVFLLAAVVMLAQASKLDGLWEGKMEHEGQTATISFEFHATGPTLTGKVILRGKEFGDILDAKVEGGKFSFKAKDVSFEGALDGDQLKLTATDSNGEKTAIAASRKAQNK